MNDLVIYGFGGFGREIASLIKEINKAKPTWNFLGFIDDGETKGKSNNYGSVLGDINFLNSYAKPLSVILSIADPQIRFKIVNNMMNPLISWPNIIAPDVKLFDQDSFSIGKGNVIFYSCRLSCGTAIGDFNLLNSLVAIGHDTRLGNFNVLMPNTRISGNSAIGDLNFFGVSSLMLQNLKVGNNTRIGVASVLMRNTKDNFLYFGNPAKRIKEF